MFCFNCHANELFSRALFLKNYCHIFFNHVIFSYRIKILPMGSYPRIMDTSNNTYDL